MDGLGGEASRITALLGPTNTGKTHRALLRMLDHETGMIGLPLRLLAREVYDRLSAQVGESRVALITGEEKRVPSRPRYFVCTVEAMPMDREVDFLAVDEIQLSAHPQRGHVFTERLLLGRGRRETMFLGADTVRPLLTRLVPTAKIHSHPRLSRLRAVPPTPLAALPPRSAVVAFSASRVIELAERIRMRRGGAALVLGALSPRTRNAQVALYESGEVDYLVATDAIGMGLNLNIDHVAFADLTKFDGRESRPLELPEMAQIAGRAGRYLRDGTFGVMAPHPQFSAATIEALTHHHFAPKRHLIWRSSELDFSTLGALVESLRRHPPARCLHLIEHAPDTEALVALSRLAEVRERADSPERVELLWDICQIPDYRQLLFELHTRLLCSLFLQLTGNAGKLDGSFVDARLRAIDDVRGDIDTLMGRIADIRIWTYVANHPRWIESGAALAERARDIEDRLSDALHERLVARFVDRTRLGRTHRTPKKPGGSGKDASLGPFAALLSLAGKLAPEGAPAQDAALVERIVEAEHGAFHLDATGRITFEGERLVGCLLRGTDILHPDVRVRLTPEPGPGARHRLQRRLLAFVRDVTAQMLEAFRPHTIAKLSPAGRGLVYQVEQGLGTASSEAATSQLSLLTPRDTQILSSLGLCFGQHHVYLRRLLTPERVEQRLGLCHAFGLPELDELTRVPAISLAELAEAPPAASLLPAGYALKGCFAIRVDEHERLMARLQHLSRQGPFRVPPSLPAQLDCSASALIALLAALGYQSTADGRYEPEGGPRRRSARHRRRRGRAISATPAPPSPSPAAPSSAHPALDDQRDG